MSDSVKRAPTIRDVARECGRSHMTVSNVLNNRGPVSEKTRAEVLAAMRRLNFRPNAIARGLNRKPMNTLGIVLPNAYQTPTSHPYYARVLDGAMDAAIARKADVIVYTGSLWAEGADPLPLYRDGRSDGLLLVSPSQGASLVSTLVDSGAPFVCIGDYYPEPAVPCVCIDDRSAEEGLVLSLIGMGHRRIAMLSGETPSRCVLPREDGYRAAMESHGLEPWILPGGFEEDTIRPRLEELAGLPTDRRPTAVCATNDQMALKVLSVLADLGVRVPQDLSVAGFDDARDAAAAGLTTVRQPVEAIAARAVEMLAARIFDQAEQPEKVFFPTELVIRMSTAPPRGH